MDGVVYPENLPASAAVSAAVGVGGLATMQRLAAPAVLQHSLRTQTPVPPFARYALLYGMGLSCVAVWRGAWLAWDAAFEAATGRVATEQPTVSGFVSHAVAIGALGATGYLSSVLSPPVACLLLGDDAVRKRNCAQDAGVREARREFLKGATWLFGLGSRRVPR